MSKIFIVSSVSASGKTTLVNHINFNYDLYKLKTCTTRNKRKEEYGHEYYFMGMDDFIDNIDNDEFVEHSLVYGKYYGLLKKEVEKNKNKNSIVILDVQGMQKFKKLYPQAITIFINPPPREILTQRLSERQTGMVDLGTRLSQIDEELNHIDLYDHRIEYGDLDYMKAQISKIIGDNILKVAP